LFLSNQFSGILLVNRYQKNSNKKLYLLVYKLLLKIINHE